MPRDVLEDLLARATKAQRRRQRQADLEAEAMERVQRKRKLEELTAAFDAERFRFLATTMLEFKGMDIAAVRKKVDDEMERSVIRDYNSKRKAGKH